MCGIVGYIGSKSAVPVLIKGLECLEYRGYDSAGIACLEDGQVTIRKEKGKVIELKKELGKKPIMATVGIGHTRWATHGEPSRANAHPHMDDRHKIVLVHNGIVENYLELKKELQKKGHKFFSATDTEVAANMIGHYYKEGNFIESFRKAIRRLEGFYAFVTMDIKDPSKLYIFKRANPIVIGLGEGENFVASDVSALLPYTSKVIYLEDEEYAVLSRERVGIYSLATGKLIHHKPTQIQWTLKQAQKGGYPHFMLKEIEEQPAILQESIHRMSDKQGNITLEGMTPKVIAKLKNAEKVFMVSCGTAYHAGMIGGTWMEQFARLSSEARVSSEFRYQHPVIGPETIAVFITQSGETADTLAALRSAKAAGAFTIGIVNVLGSTIAREADYTIYTHAGPEIGVASTKAYTAQLITLIFFALFAAKLRNALPKQEILKILREIQKLPKASAKVLKQAALIGKCAQKQFRRQSFLYIGRGVNFPSALEGALKLKEISYAHAHGYAAGEMKHGPIALVDKNQPVICIAPQSQTRDKVLSNIQEIRARHGIVIAIGTEGDGELKKMADDMISIPPIAEPLSCILTAIPLQLFAYKISVLNKRDVDKPRNLAKSVTVE